MKKYNYIPFYNTRLDGGFWGVKQRVAGTKTLDAVYEQFKNTKRFEAVKCDIEQQEKEGWKSHVFWDSDTAKWIEGAAFRLEDCRDDALEARVDEIIDRMLKSRRSDGYYNCYFNTQECDKRFTNRDAHELYCLGHLIEAAVAYHHATGKDKLLSLVCDYTDLVIDIFQNKSSAGFLTPGHEEIELALVKLYRVTGEKKYLELSKFFVDRRGNNDKDPASCRGWDKPEYSQDHLPPREQKSAEGHSVRAHYLYCAMADLAKEYSDTALFDACKAIFENIISKRMYITGATGSSRLGESYTLDMDLDNETAYAETCAAISLAYFAHRMSELDADSRYADTLERIIYNGSISGLSLDGEKFFYTNPLSVNLKKRGRITATKELEHLPLTQRVRVFGCSCCPPNILRFVLSIADYLYTYSDDTLFVHQYMKGKTVLDGAEIIQDCDYPSSGDIKIRVGGTRFKTLALRIPCFCKKFSLKCGGRDANYILEKGYAYISVKDGDEISLSLEIKPRLVVSNRGVRDNAGKTCIMYGPLVYCLEGVDTDADIFSVSIQRDANLSVKYDELFGVPAVYASCLVKKESEALYSDISELEYEEKTFKFIPYFANENRGECDMLVWIPLA